MEITSYRSTKFNQHQGNGEYRAYRRLQIPCCASRVSQSSQ